jgi:serine protease Do
MRRIVSSIVAVLAIVAVALACGADNRAEAGAPAKASTPPLFTEAVAATTPTPAEIPQLPSLAPIIERLKPAVVNISTTTAQKNPHRGQRGPGQGQPFDDFFERYFGRPGPDEGEEFRGHGLGSGFLISTEGYILTNNHVIENATDIKVRLSDDRVLSAKVVGRDPATDVALIQLNNPPKSLPVAVLGDSDALRQGDFVLALGSPFGLLETATLGIVSAKNRSRINPGSPGGTYDDYIQTDSAINPGNSGGPLYNLRGEVVGINTAIVSPQIGQGIGFAVPINLAKSLLPQLREKGKVVRGYLGVSVGELTSELTDAFGLPKDTKGALVQQVVPKTPAAKGGVQEGDVIVALNGKPVATPSEVTRAVAMIPPGEKVNMTVLRKGQKKDLSFAVGTRPDEQAVATGEQEEPEQGGGKSPKLGVTLQPLTADIARQLGISGGQGVIVTDVAPGGPAEEAGLQRGDVIVSVNQQPVTAPDQVAAVVGKLKAGEKVLLRVRRGPNAFFVAVPIGGGVEK